MIKLCERCFASIGADDEVVRLAHIDVAGRDGTVQWVYTYVHTSDCMPPRMPVHQRPDPGTWDATRGIRSRQQP